MKIKNIKSVFYIGSGNSGIDLFCSLLDNLDEIVIIPFSLKVYSLFKKDTYKKKDINKLVKIIINSKLKNLSLEKKNKKHFFNIETTQNDKFFEWEIFKNTLKKNIRNIELNRKNIIKIIYASYAVAAGKNLNKVKYFFIDATYNDYTIDIIKDFQKEVSFLFLMRDPRDNFLSLTKHFYNLHHTNYPFRYLYRNLYDHIILYNLAASYRAYFFKKNNFNPYIFKFDEVSQNSKLVLKKFCKFYRLKFKNSLTDTTYLGQKIWHQSSYGNYVSGVSKKRVARYKSDLNIFNIAFIEKIFEKTLKEFKYKFYIKNIYFKNFLFLLSYIYPLNNEIYPSTNIIKQKSLGIKNNFFFKIFKYLFYLTRNLILFFYNRIFKNFKYYFIRL